MDLTCKARCVKDGHVIPDLKIFKYAGVVSRESVQSTFTYATLHRIAVLAVDIRNTYLQVPTSKKHYAICDIELGLEIVGKQALIVRTIYGGKTAEIYFYHNLRNCVAFTGFNF